MENALIAPNLIVLALNIATAAIALSVVGLLIGKIPRPFGLPLQHGLLCVVVFLTLLSPAPIWLSYRCGMGLMTFSSAILERHHTNEDSLESSSKLNPEIVLPHRTSQNQRTGNDTFNNIESSTKRMSSGLPAPREESSQNAIGVSVFQCAGSLLILIWGIIAFWYTTRLVQGLFVVRRIQRSLRLSTDPRLIAAAKQTFCAAGVDSTIAIFESRFVPAPLTLGWWKSSVVMPHGLADVLDDKQLASILAHEVAHIVRRDTMIALIQQIAAALFWWNPLLRTVNRQISQLRERLCDDCVVIRYGDGIPLAESIVQVAQWSATRTLSSPLSLALLEDFSDLEDRIHRLTEENRTRLIHLSKRSLVVVGIVGSLLGLMLLLPVVRAQDGDPKPNAKTKSDSHLKDEKTAESNPQASVLRGHVHNEEGRPLAAVRIRVSIPSTDTRYVYPGTGFKRWEAQTDANGDYRIEIPEIASSTHYSIDAMKCGYRLPIETPVAFDVRQPKLEPGAVGETSLTLTTALYFKGTVIDEEGNPISDAEINANFSDGNAVERTVSGTDGGFELFNFPDTNRDESKVGWFSVTHRNYISAKIDDVYRVDENQRKLLKVVLRTGHKASGTVFDLGGKPVPNLLIKAYPTDAFKHKAVLTDAKGRFALQGLAENVSLSAVAFDLKQKIDPWIPIEQDVNDLIIRLQPITLPANLRTYQVLGMTLADATPELIRAYDDYAYGRPGLGEDFGGVMVLDPGETPGRFGTNLVVKQGSIFWSVPSAQRTNVPQVISVQDFIKQIISAATEQETDEYQLLVCYTLSTHESDYSCTSNMKITKAEFQELKTVLEKLNTDGP